MIETSVSQKEFNERLKLMPVGVYTELSDNKKSELHTIRISLNEARKQWSAAGHKIVDRTERKRRYGICRRCDSLIVGRCKECGCFMQLKSLLAGMTCKLNKW